jgi:succinate dehydrogenase/fumarate reductase iron-sulfur protein
MMSASDDEDTVVLRIVRCEPGGDPTAVEYTVPRRRSWSILDALQHIKDRIDPTLSFRGSCRMGICGSCGVKADGTPVLACGTFLRDARGPLVIEPLDHFPVERDLIVGVDDALGSLTQLQTYLRPATPARPGDPPRRQTPAQLRAYRHYSMCINCMLCYSACPQYGLDDFLGPAALALAQRYNLDSRDAGSAVRLERAGARDGVWRCTVVGTCTEVCPAKVQPATAIQQLKVASATHGIRPLVSRGRAPLADASTSSASDDTGPSSAPASERRRDHRAMGRLWWTRQRSYRRYMIRESTALLTAAYAVFLLYMAVLLCAGGLPIEARVERATRALVSPGALLLHAIALPFLALHAFSWLRIAPLLLSSGHSRAWVVAMWAAPVLAAVAVVAGALS